MIYTWPSPAKINLFLYVTGIRSDGYHYIQSLFQFLNYGDTLKIIPNKTGNIELFTEKKLFLKKTNTIIEAAKLLKSKALYYEKTNCTTLGAKIFLNKKIPIGSGLGGGSSNAATVLVVLNKLWRTKFTLQELAKFSLNIGSDIPAFIMGKTSIIEGIGEILHPIEREEKWYLIVYPEIHVLTKNIFSSSLLKSKTQKKPIQLLLTSPFSNDFENIVSNKFKTIKKLLSILSLYAPTRMTGTGSCVFAEFNDKTSAQKIFSLLPKNMKGFIAKSVNTSPLHHVFYKQNKHIFN
ncbi:4-(cytidine 5'-diphospho)-2-C-methyl-D-erythritol kinase [Buchnera aphidicola (Aphis helianthi)]|uniref:4-diphosphocytidyl-2-C-methyl-D-erythritol kinase n=1 Tax=Buchnera aphidicola (Aphis helianthi) TaxID=2315802 RepID=A0A4D6XJR8_9GAMM|nr:4-(cytidine 5'-diphospho)-2-C-methyl-D-erythritol kinase [Buchnera aphidicola]QCI17002.1 4-(cytidine 5'-diphospho)-2-C-methyl-D-erythritol kinase [Buchnera aphidicola (Aphis helianthi)]